MRDECSALVLGHVKFLSETAETQKLRRTAVDHLFVLALLDAFVNVIVFGAEHVGKQKLVAVPINVKRFKI